MFCLGGMLAAEAARIPFVVLFPNVYPLPARGLPPFGMGLRPARGRLGRWRDETLNRIIERQWDRKGLTDLNTLRRTTVSRHSNTCSIRCAAHTDSS